MEYLVNIFVTSCTPWPTSALLLTSRGIFNFACTRYCSLCKIWRNDIFCLFGHKTVSWNNPAFWLLKTSMNDIQWTFSFFQTFEYIVYEIATILMKEKLYYHIKYCQRCCTYSPDVLTTAETSISFSVLIESLVLLWKCIASWVDVIKLRGSKFGLYCIWLTMTHVLRGILAALHK